MAERWFLKLDGIEGESVFDKHKGEIDVEAWSWGVTNTGSFSTGGGGGAGKASFEDLHFVARLSKASPKLFQACASGSHIKQANLTGERGAGKQKGNAFYKVRLDEVLVSSFQQSDSEDGALPTDQFSLNFAKIEVSYFAQDKTGKTQPPVIAGWDVKQNKKV